MRPRSLSRREAALAAAMLAALALAWRETHGPDPLRPGPGRAGPRLYAGASPAVGGHQEDAAPETAAPAADEPLRDAPAEPSPFTPMLALPPLAAQWPQGGDAPVAGSTPRHASPVRRTTLPSKRATALKTNKLRPPAQRSSARAEKNAAEPPAVSAPGVPTKRASAPAITKTPRAAPLRPTSSAARPRAAAEAPARHAPAARRERRFSVFHPTPAARARSRRERARRPPRFKPIRLDRALGPYAIRPPGDVAGPTLAQLSPRQPLAKPDGKPARWTEAPLRWLETVDPAAPASPCRKRDGHWHGEQEGRFYHAGIGRGLALDDAWLWLARLERRWWALPDAERAPWLRHRGRWWVRDDGVWFVLHEGESWAWRHFARWEAEGLIHPGTGTAIVYSADYARAAVITPGEGAVLFDALSGAELARWTEAELPPRWRPAPRDLNLPAGI